MVETNIRIVDHGPNLHFTTRLLGLTGQDITPDLKEKVCNVLRRKRLASVPCSEGILVAAATSINSFVLSEDNWQIKICDEGTTKRLSFSNPDEASMLAQLFERCLLIETDRYTKLWTLSSPRIFYESTFFKKVNDIGAYRRYDISGIPIEGVGIGLAVDISTAFFTVLTVADFFKGGEQSIKRFENLSCRQRGQKGTLLYDSGRNKTNCYFEEFSNTTCANTGTLRVKGKDYPSLYEYYQQERPSLNVNPSDPVAKVSFPGPGIDRPVPVAANMLRLRVMNDVVPHQLKQVDKISPADRRTQIQKFWANLGDCPLGAGRPSMVKSFWKPQEQRLFMKAPTLEFAKGTRLSAQNSTPKAYRSYYHKRFRLLDQVGCLEVPPAVCRKIHIRMPNTIDETTAKQFAEDLITYLCRWTNKKITFNLDLYQNVDDALARLRQEFGYGIVVFVFQAEDPATYFNVSYELKEWRVKRVTSQSLVNHFRELSRNKRNWDSFIAMNALDVLQQMDCVPWRLATPLHYDAQLAIDVGRDKRYFALSLLISRSELMQPAFRLNTLVKIKPDAKHETINEVVLKDAILELFQQVKRDSFDSLRSMLILRDGRQYGRELESVALATRELIKDGLLKEDVRIATVDFHKRSVKRIRMWWTQQGQTANVREGTACIIDAKTVVLANTGVATLSQGTVELVMLVAHQDNVNISDMVQDVHSATHLNWSNPRIAQRLPIELKRTDEELTKKANQEIRRMR